MNRNSIIIVVVLVVLAVAGYVVFGTNIIKKSTNKADTVATVNGVVVLKTAYDTQLANAISSYKSQGVDVENADKLTQIKSQVLDDLINNELVNQGIASTGITTTAAEVETQVQNITTQAGGADKFKEELTKANLTEAQLRENISKQLSIQKYLSANIDVKAITVTDAEITQFYTDYSNAQKTASSTAKVPPLKDLSEQIKQQITTNKQQTLVNAFLQTLRSKAQIVKMI